MKMSCEPNLERVLDQIDQKLECELWTADERFFNSVRERQPRVRWLGEFSAAR